MKDYRDRSGIQVSSGNFYRELSRLVADQHVQMVDNPTDADPRRAPYQITDVGRAAFDAWLSSPGDPMSGSHEDELSARALFLANSTPELVGKILDHWKEELWLRGKLIERARQASLVQQTNGSAEGFAALPVLLARRLKRVAADLEFIEEFRSAYEEWSQEKPRSPPPNRTPARRR